MWATAKLFLVCFVFFLCITLRPTHALVRRHRFEVRNSPMSRLCRNKTVLTVNGQFPGPTIYARRGESFIVDVINLSDQNITIHWHGVKMPRNPWSDGPAYVTQCPITPGNKFSQRVILSDEEGTLWWHGHNEWSRATVYGALVVLPRDGETYPFPKPHAQVPILLGEWWIDDVQEVREVSLRKGIDPLICDALVINGQPGDLFPCSTQDMYKLRVESGKTYLIRIVGATMDFIMFFMIADHNFTVVGADGAYTKPFTTDYIVIAPGQTIDFLLEANQPPSRYYMASRVYSDQGDSFEGNTTTGYIEYVGNYATPLSPPLPSLPPIHSPSALDIFTDQLRSLANVEVPNNVTRILFYTLSVNLQPCHDGKATCSGGHLGRLRSSINNVTLVLPTTASILEAYYLGINGVYETDFPDKPLPSPFDYTNDEMSEEQSRAEFGTKVSVLEYNSAVEIVLQGTNVGHGVENPMHLHGHSFYVVGSGYGNFDPNRDPADYNLVDPPLMQTVNVPKNAWTAIRFIANNPGVWFFHCHFERHHSIGMAMAFIVKDGEDPHEKMLPPPPDMPWCSDPHSRISRPTPAGAFTNFDVDYFF